MNHYDYMSLAMQEAKKALTSREIPIGAIIEPCPMCAGAAVNAHLSSIIYGAPNPRYGGIDSKFRIVQNPFNHAVSVIRGVCQSECQQLMDEFFDDKRHLSM